MGTAHSMSIEGRALRRASRVARRPAAARDGVTVRAEDRFTVVVAAEGGGACDPERIACAVDAAISADVRFVIVELGDVPAAAAPVAALAPAARRLAARSGGLAVVARPALAVACRPPRTLEIFPTRAEALARVRGRLVPPRSLGRIERRAPRRVCR
jgi:hypothetical protein